MKRAIILSVGLLAAATVPVMAADIPVKAPIAAPVMAPVYSWTGFYVGLNAGYSWGQTDIDYSTPFATVGFTHHPDSFIGGGQIGYNWQSGWVVYGLEADIAYRHRNRSSAFFFGSTPTVGAPFGSVAGDNTIFSTEQNWLGTVRGRLGFTAGSNWLIYGTGGLAYGEVKHSLIETLVAPNQGRFRTASESRIGVGWTAGAGVEWGFGNWSVGAEYLYVDLGSSTITQGATTNLVVFPADTTSFSDTSHIVRAKLNYRFGFGAGPLVARY
jgi:outer membrane immunogenic protein